MHHNPSQPLRTDEELKLKLYPVEGGLGRIEVHPNKGTWILCTWQRERNNFRWFAQASTCVSSTHLSVLVQVELEGFNVVLKPQCCHRPQQVVTGHGLPLLPFAFVARPATKNIDELKRRTD